MKKILILFLVLCCVLSNTALAQSMVLEYDGGVHEYSGSVYRLNVNGKILTDLPLEPIIFNDRALVPVREVFEGLGATVGYDGSNKTIKIDYGTKTVALQIDSDTAYVDGKKKSIPDGAAPKLIAKKGESAKTMVPVRFISENVGLDVGFDGDSGIISISDGSGTAMSPSLSSSVLNRVSFSEDSGTVTIIVSAKGEIAGISGAALTAAGVLYVDVYGASYSVANSIDVNLGAVQKVRFGQHDAYSRVAVDTSGIGKYSAVLSGDKKSIVITVASGSSTNLSPVAPTPTVTPTITPDVSQIEYNQKKIVVLDAGHGGSDPGASSYLMTDDEIRQYYAAMVSTEPILATLPHGSGRKYNEKDIALSVTKKVKQKLEANGINVIMTREGDTYPTLDSRPALANERGAVLFVSIHLNSTAYEVTAAKGIEVYYSEQNNRNDLGVTSKDLAQSVLNGAVSSSGARSRGVKTGNLLVNRKCMMPSALIEIGFMNNPEELELMASDAYQEKLAEGISQGIINAHKKVVLP